MGRGVKVEISGDAELKRKLELLGAKARAALLDAARSGAEEIEREADKLAPEPHIEIGDERVEGGTAEVSIGPDDAHWYYRFFEFGATRHEIKGNPLVFEGEKGLIVTRRVNHPGMPARPFLRPAADMRKEAAVKRVGETFRREIDKLVE